MLDPSGARVTGSWKPPNTGTELNGSLQEQSIP